MELIQIAKGWLGLDFFQGVSGLGLTSDAEHREERDPDSLRLTLLEGPLTSDPR